ncbi:condensation domain-containing protein, partial [Aquimarina algiphila]
MKEILNRISKEGLVLDVKNGELQIFSTKDEVDDKLISEIKSRKKELITYLIRYKKSSLQSTKYQEIPKCDEKESYPISNSQYRIWLASQMEDGSIAYNMPDTIVLDGAYDVDCFQKSVYAVIDRHEILRTVFKMNELGEVRQFISSAQDFNFSIDFQDFRKRDDPKVAYEKYVSIDSRKPFDLAQGPLLRASLIRLSEEQYLFYYNMHHIISDGWSMDVLSRDVMQYYKAYVSDVSPNLSPLRIQYKDYATWQLSELDGPSFKEHKEYWFSQFCEEIPAIDLPKQKRRPKVKTYNGKSIGTYIPEELTTKLRNFTKERGGSLFIGLLTVWKTLLYRYTGESHITVGNMITGREHPDLEGQIGFYINALALRNQVDPKDSFKAFYEKVKANTLKAYKYQTYPFDKLIEDLDVQRDISRNPLFEIVVNYHGVSDTDIAFEELQDFGDSLVKFDLIYGATEVSGGINLQLGYNTDVYDQEMVEGLLVHYKRLLTLF